MKYYVTQNMNAENAYPVPENNPPDISKYVRPRTMKDIGKVYGYVEYKEPLEETLLQQYGLSPAASSLKKQEKKEKEEKHQEKEDNLMNHQAVKEMIQTLEQYMPKEALAVQKELQKLADELAAMQNKLDSAMEENHILSDINEQLTENVSSISENLSKLAEHNQVLADKISALEQRTVSAKIERAVTSVTENANKAKEKVIDKAVQIKGRAEETARTYLKNARDYISFAHWELTSIKNSIVDKAKQITNELKSTGQLVKNKIKDIFDIKRPMRTVAGWMAKTIMESDNLYFKMMREKMEPGMAHETREEKNGHELDDITNDLEKTRLGEKDYNIYGSVNLDSQKKMSQLLEDEPEPDYAKEFSKEELKKPAVNELKTDFLDIVLQENRKKAAETEEKAHKISRVAEEAAEKLEGMTFDEPSYGFNLDPQNLEGRIDKSVERKTEGETQEIKAVVQAKEQEMVSRPHKRSGR